MNKSFEQGRIPISCPRSGTKHTQNPNINVFEKI